jgi:hypothetical protein
MRTKIILLFTLLAVLLALSVGVAASSPLLHGLAINWWTVDGGGGTSQGGTYTLSGTAGQSDAGTTSGGSYRLASGFWSITLVQFRNYLPVVRR